MTKKILFVVHRYAPYPGGSEMYVRNMAEEMLSRGYEVTVLAYTHQGDLNGVAVTNDHSLAFSDRWDLIVVHGGDVVSQNFVHQNASMVKSPVLYMIIKPSESENCMNGLRSHSYLGYSTSFDLDLIKKYGYQDKARRVRHGIPVNDTVYDKNLVRIDLHEGTRLFTSIGGFLPHKQMVPLANAFKNANIDKAVLAIFGYIDGEKPQNDKNILVVEGAEKHLVMATVANSDALIMNSSEEGFGLVLLEAMMNKTPWIARNIAGAHDLKEYGILYETEEELMEILRSFDRSKVDVEKAYKYVMENHTIASTVDDIERVVNEHN